MNNEITKSGVNTDLGSKCSKIAFSYAKKSFEHRSNKSGKVIPTVDGGYASMMDIDSAKIGISSDGIGTKIEMAERTGIYSTLGYDLLAMTIDDLSCSGFIPAFVSNILDVDKLDEEIVEELMKGLYDAAKFSDVIITGGEIAELGNRINGFGSNMHFNWCATGIGKLHSSLQSPLTGKEIASDDVILSVYNPGFRSNGYSLLRNILENNFGTDWHLEKFTDESTWGDAALEPSLIYSPLIESLLDNNIIINGIAHITGGGIVDNLGRLIKHNKLGARIDNLWETDKSIAEVIRMGEISLEKAYRYWNMSNGLLIILAKDEAEKAFDLTQGSKIYKIKKAGTVIADSTISIDTGKEKLIYTSFDNK